MIFSTPTPFSEALQAAEVKSVLPTTASSAELMDLAPELRERAFFMARADNAFHVGRVQEIIDNILQPEAAAPGQYMDAGKARLEITKALTRIGYQPDPGERGTIKDLSSDSRINLILDTQVKMAQGYGYHQQGQDLAVLDAFPAQELFREEDRNEPRDWFARWTQAGGRVFDGRMIAPKNDPVWVAISTFGLPYPPFDFNSGMGVMDVDRQEAEALGVIASDQTIAPETRNFNEDIEISAPDRQDALFTALLQSMGDAAEFVDGALRLK